MVQIDAFLTQMTMITVAIALSFPSDLSYRLNIARWIAVAAFGIPPLARLWIAGVMG